jgi:hypothetical protein
MTGYELAHAKVTEATKVYNAAVAAYRSMKIGDSEFLAAKAVYNAAEVEYEVAYAIAQGIPEDEDLIDDLYDESVPAKYNAFVRSVA